MSAHRALEALAGVTAALVRDGDVVSGLTELTQAYADLVAGGAVVGLLAAETVPRGDGVSLETLASSSHDAAQLELYQAQVGEGPSVEVMATGADVSVLGPAAMVERWPRLGDAMARGGVGAVHAVPMRWLGDTIGALNVLLPDERDLTADERAAAHAFADVAAVTLAHARGRPRAEEVAHGVRAALRGRVVIEQAKGVLMHVAFADAGTAFRLLTERARASGAPLSAVAQELVDQARLGRLPRA